MSIRSTERERHVARTRTRPVAHTDWGATGRPAQAHTLIHSLAPRSYPWIDHLTGLTSPAALHRCCFRILITVCFGLSCNNQRGYLFRIQFEISIGLIKCDAVCCVWIWWSRAEISNPWDLVKSARVKDLMFQL